MKVDVRQIKEFEKDLKAFKDRAFPFATKATINTAAFDTMTKGRRIIERNMILRNKYTPKAVQVEQTRTLIVNQQEALTGAIEDYLETQEFGGVDVKKGKVGIPLPSSTSAGQGRTKPRTRLPREANKLQNLRLNRSRRRAKSRKQKVLFVVQDAVTSGRRNIFLDLGRTQGIFNVKGGRKNFKRGGPKGAKLRMIYDLSRDSVSIPRSPWLGPAVKLTERRMPEMYLKALKFQAERHGLFRPGR